VTNARLCRGGRGGLCSSAVGNIWWFILLIGPLILVHELGHLIAAKLVDVKATRFSIGFGPALFKFRLGETEYRVAPIPLGGYVSLLGQAPGEEVAAGDTDRALSAKPLWARYFVLGAGPAANLVLPILLYFLYFLILAPVTVPPAIVGTVIDGTAAAQAGLQQGDRIVAIEDSDVRSWLDMSKRVAASPGVELQVQLERDGKRIDRVVTPRKTVRRNAVGTTSIGRLGVVTWFYVPQVGIVDPDSPAHAGGLRTGDVITSINGEPVRTIEELQRMLDAMRSEQVRLTYLRAEVYDGPLGKYMFYESAHAQLLPRKSPGDPIDLESATGLLAANTFIRSIEPGSPAARAGLKPGDRVLEIDGDPFSKWEYLRGALARKQDSPFELTVQSLGEDPRTLTMAQEFKTWRDRYKQDRKYLWFGARPYAKVFEPDREPIRGRVTYAFGAALDETVAKISMTWTALRQMLTGQTGVDQLSSVVGIFNVAGTAADQGPGDFLMLMAILSINLGFVNLLPIPILDGGHLLFFTLEAVRRRPLGQRAREIASAIGLIVIVLLVLIATRNDINRYWGDDEPKAKPAAEDR